MTDDTDAGVEVARITITRILTGQDGEQSDLIWTEATGDAEYTLTALGMLELARDTLLNNYTRGDYYEEDDPQ